MSRIGLHAQDRAQSIKLYQSGCLESETLAGILVGLALGSIPPPGIGAGRQTAFDAPCVPRHPMFNKRRTELDDLAYRLRRQGLTYRAIGERLGVGADMARRRVARYERALREAGKLAERRHRPRE